MKDAPFSSSSPLGDHKICVERCAHASVLGRVRGEQRSGFLPDPLVHLVADALSQRGALDLVATAASTDGAV
jgi:hypothetical protein